MRLAENPLPMHPTPAFRPLIRLALLALALLGCAGPASAFGFEDVAELARRNAARAWAEPVPDAPAPLRALGYDALRQIRYRPEKSIWREAGLPFQLQFFHLGGGLRLAVPVHEIAGGTARALPYDPAAWDFGKLSLDRAGLSLPGHAGFRVHHALNTPAYADELIVFLGASYFRAVGRGQNSGLSARALAIDTVGGAAGEEFPQFTGFWIERPASDAQALVIHALLDSRRATGAYRFTVRPGEETVVEVQARVFVRQGATPAPQLCLAPLTSMFQHGENQPRASDYRPEVHDSDGLMLALQAAPGGATEWLWRPLVNPATPLASSFGAAQLKGFGLMQRDRRLTSFEDTEAHYERRPSAWVEPVGDWGPGRVQLLLLHADSESVDNVVACWAPAAPPAAGRALDFAYRLHWQGANERKPPTGWTTQSRRGHGWTATPPPAGELQFVIDFDGPGLRALPATAEVQPVVSAPANGRVLEAIAHPHPQGGQRLHLRVQRLDAAQPLELRAYLRTGAQALTETWTALIPTE